MPQITINATADGDNTVRDVDTAGETGVYDYVLTASAAGTAILKDEAGTEFGRYVFGSAGQMVTAPNGGAGTERFVARGDIIINCSAGLDILGHMMVAQKK